MLKYTQSALQNVPFQRLATLFNVAAQEDEDAPPVITYMGGSGSDAPPGVAELGLVDDVVD